MHFISLGRNCEVAAWIKKYITSNQMSHFFDWLRSDFKSVLYILNQNNFDTAFNVNNIVVNKEAWAHDNEIQFTFKSLDENNLCLLFHHEVKISDFCDEKVLEFFEKYRRRHTRLMNLIKSNEQICFIYYIFNYDFDYNDCEILNQLLKSINKNINYRLFLLVNDYNEPYVCEHNQYYAKINLSKFVINSKSNSSWPFSLYDCKALSDFIQNDCSQFE